MDTTSDSHVHDQTRRPADYPVDLEPAEGDWVALRVTIRATQSTRAPPASTPARPGIALDPSSDPDCPAPPVPMVTG